MSKELLKSLSDQLQAVSQQALTVEAQIRELDGTLSALEEQDDDKPVYRQIGPLLLAVNDLEGLKQDLTSSREELSGHLTRLTQREAEIREEYEKQIEIFESA